jgi:hypothetical protein
MFPQLDTTPLEALMAPICEAFHGFDKAFGFEEGAGPGDVRLHPQNSALKDTAKRGGSGARKSAVTSGQGHPSGGDTREVNTPGKPSCSQVVSQRDRNFTKAFLRDKTGLGNTTLASYMRKAGVKMAKRGGRNHRYTRDEIRQILQQIAEETSEDGLRARCLLALRELDEIAD